MPIPSIYLLKASYERFYQAICRYHLPDADQVLGLALIKRESSILLKQSFKFWLRIRKERRTKN